MFAEINKPVFLGAQLFGRATDRGVLGRVFNSSNSEVAGSPFVMDHVDQGLYTSNQFTPTVSGFYLVRYETYTDDTYAVIDEIYEFVLDSIQVLKFSNSLNVDLEGTLFDGSSL